MVSKKRLYFLKVDFGPLSGGSREVPKKKSNFAKILVDLAENRDIYIYIYILNPVIYIYIYIGHLSRVKWSCRVDNFGLVGAPISVLGFQRQITGD